MSLTKSHHLRRNKWRRKTDMSARHLTVALGRTNEPTACKRS